ncbi:helix-turn-helix transcriptional regulator [Vibrionales bacterium C3R12]|uniref:helix-turn-helix transcriptional regulator n=1 Tax=Vibrio cortegadensis TaxID=1328770 RepID=UPI000DE97772|nr:helix-turn-helix transcriptional regulator [Vibrionales bacterium C3R12]
MSHYCLDTLIRSLYESLVSKDGFSFFLNLLVKQLNLLSGAVVMTNDISKKSRLVWAAGLDIEDASAFIDLNSQSDPLISQLNLSPSGSLITMGDVDADKMRVQHPEFFSQLNDDLDIYYATGAVLSQDGTWRSLIFFHRSRNQHEFNQQECLLLKRLIPHIQHAMQLYHQQLKQQQQAHLTELLFNQIQLPVILINEQGQVCHANTQGFALLDNGKIFRQVNQSLHLCPPYNKLLFSQALSNCLNNRTVETISLEKPNHFGYTITIAPLISDSYYDSKNSIQEPASSRPCIEGGVAIFIYSLDQPPKVNLNALCHAFGLTDKEAVICRELLNGHSPAEIAKMHHLSYETVRTYIKRAMKKTNTRRQNELVAKIITSPAYSNTQTMPQY